MKRDFKIFLQDIVNAIECLKVYTRNLNYHEFCKRKIVLDASVRNLEIIGEAIANIPLEVKAKAPEIPWTQVKSFRNIVVHQYWVIDTEILWDIIQNKIEPLRVQIKELLTKVK